jgi:5-formyltetrahydrofolate cyclo-ligase
VRVSYRVPFEMDCLSMLTPAERSAWAKGAKTAMRAKLRALRTALPSAAASARNARIIERLAAHPKLQQARAVALFWPMIERGEVDLRPLDTQLRQAGVSIYYPSIRRVADGALETGFRLVTQIEELIIRGRSFAEPSFDAPAAERGDIDLVIVPALAAAPDGHRLGYGAGFYDATLPDVCPPASSIVVVYDFQLLLELPTEAHDWQCNEVITDTGL